MTAMPIAQVRRTINLLQSCLLYNDADCPLQHYTDSSATSPDYYRDANNWFCVCDETGAANLNTESSADLTVSDSGMNMKLPASAAQSHQAQLQVASASLPVAVSPIDEQQRSLCSAALCFAFLYCIALVVSQRWLKYKGLGSKYY